jgi:hypothetical protein
MLWWMNNLLGFASLTGIKIQQCIPMGAAGINGHPYRRQQPYEKGRVSKSSKNTLLGN